jgi:dihydroorotate dehydrogenase electron transfer subunit
VNAEPRGLFRPKVLKTEQISPTCFLIALERPAGFPDAGPGHFVSLRAAESSIPLLRRPFSILDLTEDAIFLLVKVVGAGTSLLAGLERGDSVDLLGPLGGSIFPSPAGKTALFVAGGTGLAPVVHAARAWARRGELERSVLLYGAGVSEELLSNLVKGSFTETMFATLDGSSGFHGDVVELCEREMEKGTLPADVCYSCGPKGMVRAIVERLDGRFGVHYTSLEAVMACGVGACRGCTVPVTAPAGMAYRAICSEGTVFDVNEIAWKEWEK